MNCRGLFGRTDRRAAGVSRPVEAVFSMDERLDDKLAFAAPPARLLGVGPRGN
jgi:hypothetical protein